MPELVLLPGTVRRSRGDLPQLPLQNMFAEEAITEPKGFTLQSRLNLIEGVADGAYDNNTIAAIFSSETVVEAASGIVVAQAAFYAGGVNIAAPNFVTNTIPSIAAISDVGVVVAGSGNAGYYDGSTVQDIEYIGGGEILASKVVAHQSRLVFIAGPAAYTNEYFWTAAGTGMLSGGNVKVDPLAFSSAESEPDALVDMVVYNDHLVLGGTKTIEFHGVTGNNDLPWSKTLGSTITKGVFYTGFLVLFDDAIAWLSPAFEVFQSGGAAPIKISDPGIEELLRARGNPSYMDSFTYQGHELLRIKLGGDDPDLVFDAQTRKWCEWYSLNQDGDPTQWIGGPTNFSYGDGGAGELVFGSALSIGKIYEIEDAYFSYIEANGSLPSYVDYAEDPPEMIFRCGLPIDGGVVTINNLLLRCEVGADDNAVIQMRFSRDKGHTWTSWIDGDLGDEGDYRTKVEWRSLGMQDQPGFLAEIKVTGTREFSVSGAYYNEPVMGRSRG